MRFTRRILTFLLLAAVAVAVYFGYRSTAADALAADREAARAADRARLSGYQTLLGADSLFHAGDYRGALAAYQRMTAADTLDDIRRALVAREDHAQQLLQVSSLLDSLQIRASRRPAVISRPVNVPATQPVRPAPLENSDPSQYDSLVFALQKAETQIRNLQGRIRRSSEGNYLTFTSRQGNEVYYVGEVRDGKANGRGVALLSSGSRYQGEWRDNLKHGIGEFYWTDGAYYEGEYENDQRSGEGTYHFPNGETFVGEWADDLRNGEGVFYGADGKVVASGRWEDDELVE